MKTVQVKKISWHIKMRTKMRSINMVVVVIELKRTIVVMKVKKNFLKNILENRPGNRSVMTKMLGIARTVRNG